MLSLWAFVISSMPRISMCLKISTRHSSKTALLFNDVFPWVSVFIVAASASESPLNADRGLVSVLRACRTEASATILLDSFLQIRGLWGLVEKKKRLLLCKYRSKDVMCLTSSVYCQSIGASSPTSRPPTSSFPATLILAQGWRCQCLKFTEQSPMKCHRNVIVWGSGYAFTTAKRTQP